MVSTATKVGQFTFANCLMNAAGVHCMTKEELAEVEASAVHLSQKQEHLRPVPVILNHVM